MNVKERFEELIKYIEKQVENSEEKRARDIADDATKKDGMQFRDLNNIFCYLTGDTLMNYIKERKMMHVYKTMGDMKLFDEWDIEKLTDLSDYETPSSFSRGFKNTFGLSPSDEYKNYDGNKYKDPLTWEALANCTSFHFQMPQFKFGLSISQVSRYYEAEELQLMYDLTDEQSDYAFQMSLACDIPMESAFHFCEGMDTAKKGLDELIKDLDMNPQNWTKEEKEKVTHIIELYESFEITFTRWVGYTKYLEAENRTIFEVQPEIFKYYLDQNFTQSYSYIEHLYKEYQTIPGLKAEYPDFLECLDELMTTDADTFTEWVEGDEWDAEEEYQFRKRVNKYIVDSYNDRRMDELEERRMRRMEAEALYDGDPTSGFGGFGLADPYRSFDEDEESSEEDEESIQTGMW